MSSNNTPPTMPRALPTIPLGFSTQKLTWSSATTSGGPDSPEKTPEGIPFNVGLWEGPDGETILAALNPGGYGSRIRSDLSKPEPHFASNVQRGEPETDWASRIQIDGKATGVFADYHYVGTGDIGGAADEETVRLLEATVTQGQAVIPPPGFNSGDLAGPAPEGTPVRMGDGSVRVISAAADQIGRAS